MFGNKNVLTNCAVLYNRRMDERYAKNAGAVFSLKYHVVWCPKYRRPVLVGRSPIAALLAEKSAELGHDDSRPRSHAGSRSPVRRKRPDSVRCRDRQPAQGLHVPRARDEFPSLRSRLPTLWSRSYFAGSVGHVSAATVERYIAEQKGK